MKSKGKREIERQLYSVAKEKIRLEEEKKQKNIQRIVEMELPVSKNGTIKDFICSQISFLNKTVVFWQVAWMIAFFYLLEKGELFHVNHEMFWLVSMAPPLLLLLTVEEVTRVYQRSMLEIEYATKYSLKKVVMIRLLILSIANGLVILVGVLVAKNQLQLTLADILLYGITPLIWMACVILMLMKKWMGEQLKYAAVGCYGVFALVIAVSRIKRFYIYAEAYREVWMLLLVCGVIGLVYQVKGLQNHLNRFERMMEE